MGIKGLRDLLKRKQIKFEEIVPISDFTNKRIVVDVSLYIYLYKTKTKTKTMFEETFIKFFTTLLEYNIHPMFVFDGLSPKEKEKEKKERSNKKRAQYNKIERIENDIENFEKSNIITQELWDINDRICNKNSPQLKIRGDNNFSIDNIKKWVIKTRSNIPSVCDLDFSIVKSLLSDFGIPFIIAKGEAEILCSEMVKRGIADAVLTKDTDVLACCVPIMIYDIDLENKQFTLIKLNNILQQLNLNKDSWVDLCVMCGTDYNERIPRIGPTRSLDFIKKYGSIQKFSENEENINTECLAHERTKHLLQCDDCPNKLEPLSGINFDRIAKRIKERNLNISISSIYLRLYEINKK